MPEQMKLLASRESVARFCMPYGPDAVAYADTQLHTELPAGLSPSFDFSGTGDRVVVREGLNNNSEGPAGGIMGPRTPNRPRVARVTSSAFSGHNSNYLPSCSASAV